MNELEKKQKPAVKPVLKTPAEWTAELKLKPYYLPGVQRYAGWQEEQQVSREEFERQLNAWLHRPVGRTVRRG